MNTIFDFLKALKENNNREWFEQNKQWYLQAKDEHEQMLHHFIEGINEIDPYTGKPLPKDCVFRIYRDVRFSPNKLPYKTHLGAYIANGGRKSEKAGYYLHIEPGNSMVGGGIYMPQPDVLKRVRDEIYFDAATFRALLEKKSFKQLSLEMYEDKITRAPKGYDPSFPEIELLKYKSYFVDKALDDSVVLSSDFLPQALKICKEIVGVNNFLNRAFIV